MNKRLWLNALCGFSLLCSPAVADVEAADMVHAPMGTRIAAAEQYSSEQQARATLHVENQENGLNEKGMHAEKANFVPSAEILAASLECLANNENEKGLFGEEGSEKLHAKATYFTSHPNALHYVMAVTYPYGDPIQLEDGSIWSIYSGDSYKTLNWLTTDNILIFPNRNPVWNSIYPYSLFNQQTGTFVQAIFTSASWFQSPYSRWVYAIDYYNCQLCLSDGSVWNVPFSESWMLNSFLPGDYVIIGFNDTPGNGLGSNILINFNTMQYMYSTCLYY